MVQSEAKISDTFGGFNGVLDDSDSFGYGVANLGDLDGDGVPDLAVGAPGDDDGGPARGAVWILFMNSNGTVRAEQKISDTAGGFSGVLDNDDQFGGSVANLGDVDTDGVPDLAVGAESDDDGGTNRGAVWILFMNSNGTVRTHQKISDIEGGFNGVLDDTDGFGQSVANLGDLDGDSVPDLAVGAIDDDDGGPTRGAVWVLFMNSNGTVRAEQKISDTAGGFGGGLDDGDRFGSSIANLGDLDGDGIADLAVGAYGDDDGGGDRGAVWILFMNSNGTVRANQKISDTAGGFNGVLDDSDNFGISVASLGDINGNAMPDLAVGAWLDDDGGPERGAAWILSMNANGMVRAVQKISDIAGGFAGVLNTGDLFGASLAGLGDFDGDGVPDVAVGAVFDNDGGLDRGAVWVLRLGGCFDPVITAQPPCVVLLPAGGGIAQFSISASGTPSPAYQWRKDTVPLVNGGPIAGANSPMLTIAADLFDVGVYDCVVTNTAGQATSSPAALAVRGCIGDADGNGAVNFADITAVLSQFNTMCP